MTMRDNCKNWNWPEFIAGRAEDSFTSSPDAVVCIYAVFTSQFQLTVEWA